MKVSIIIPVYNAEKYIKKAILSALEQKETEEILIIDDGSTDNSFKICKELANHEKKIRLFQHSDKGNHGAGASRNLGLKNCRSEYIAFLDADDFFLQKRFKEAAYIFKKYSDAEGVYEAVGVHYYTKEGKKNYLQYNAGENLNTLDRKIYPEKLFDVFIKNQNGYIHLNGLVVRKEVCDKIGFFDETLKQTQDTDMIWRLSEQCRLYPGRLDAPIAKRGIHNSNRIFQEEKTLKYRVIFYNKWFLLMLKKNWAKDINRLILRRKLSFQTTQYSITNMFLPRLLCKFLVFISLIIRYPVLISKII